MSKATVSYLIEIMERMVIDKIALMPNCMSHALHFLQIQPNIKFIYLYCISNHKNIIPKYLDNALTDSV